MTTPSATPSTTGLAPNVAGALAYLLGPITGIAFLVLEKQNRFVRFHAAQSTVLFIALVVFGIVLSIVGGILAFVPLLGLIVGLGMSIVVGFGSFVLWLLLMWQAFQGKEWALPIVAPYARRLAGTAPASTI